MCVLPHVRGESGCGPCEEFPRPNGERVAAGRVRGPRGCSEQPKLERMAESGETCPPLFWRRSATPSVIRPIVGLFAMPIFVHLTPESRVALIRRNGIGRLRKSVGARPGGIFAVPVTRNFYVSHQWLRELKRRGQGSIAGVYFRVSGGELVWVGHYGQAHRPMTAAQATAEFMAAENREGWEVIIPRRIEPTEIHRVRSLPQVVGWRFSPGAKGRPPYCTCKYCIGGDYGAARLRARLRPPGE
jgi:hypothetical protein